MHISIRLTALTAMLMAFIVSPSSADTVCPLPSDRVSEFAFQSRNLERSSDVATVVGSEISFSEIATGEIHILPNDVPGIGEHRADSERTELSPTVRPMPKRKLFGGEASQLISVPEPKDMLLLACGLTGLFLVRWRITPK